MMRSVSWLAAAAAACGVAFLVSSAGAQTTPPKCGVETWSAADMRYVSTPCASETTKTSDGKTACGVETWSAADMRYVSTPCTAQAPKSSDGKQTCGGEAWSQAEMRYVTLPCAQR
jgi:hypothetical protein